MRQIRIEDLGTIRFTSVPRGGAPLSIREQWIGVEVPCLFSHDGVPNDGDSMHDVETGLEVPDYPGYIVLQTHAIEALQQKSPEAADYWMERGFPNHAFALFLFHHSSAEVVKPVKTRQEFWRHFVYRTATSADYAHILQLLIEGDEQGVLVRSLYRSDIAPYPLLSISQGPYQLSQDGIEGYSLQGESHTIRITDTSLHNVEMRQGQGDWIAPEMGGVILLIAQ